MESPGTDETSTSGASSAGVAGWRKSYRHDRHYRGTPTAVASGGGVRYFACSSASVYLTWRVLRLDVRFIDENWEGSYSWLIFVIQR